LAAYRGTFTGPFLADDLGAIAGNPTIRHWMSALAPPAGGTPVEGRPLVNLSLAANYVLSGSAVGSYHVINLLIHVLVGLTLFGVVHRTLARIFPAEWAFPLIAAGLIALIWTVHPLQTEAVTYLSQRSESLMGLFYLLTLYAFIRSVEPSARARGWAIVSVASCSLGMATKEVMVTAPLMVWLYDRCFLAGSFAESWRRRRALLIALGCSWALLAALMVFSRDRAGTVGFNAGVPWWAYGLTQFRAVAHYLRLCFLPWPLIADYGRSLGGKPSEVALDAVVVIVLVSITVALLVRRPAWGFLGAWFFLILAPTSTIVPIATEILAERRAYLSVAAPVTAAVLVVLAIGRSVLPGLRGFGLAVGLCVVVAGLGIIATARRNRVYRSAEAFWTDVALKIPSHAGAQNNLGNLALRTEHWDEAEAHYRAALRFVPAYADANSNLANLLARRERWEEAIEHYQIALRYRPNDPAIRLPLGQAFYRLGNALAEAGKLPNAAQAYQQALLAAPSLADAHANFGLVLAQLDRAPEAMRELEAAVRLEPGAADVHNNLGGLLAQSGRLADARIQFELAVRLKPDYREARDNLQRVDTLISRGLARP